MDIINQCDIVVDVGGIYDLQAYFYDIYIKLSIARDLIITKRGSMKCSMKITPPSSVLLVLCIFILCS